MQLSLEMELSLKISGFMGPALTWEQLGFEARLQALGRTIQQTMDTINYHKCIACLQTWVSQRTASHWVQRVKTMLERYLDLADWKLVRFSDEVHCRWEPQHRLQITQKPGQWYCNYPCKRRIISNNVMKSDFIAGRPWVMILSCQ